MILLIFLHDLNALKPLDTAVSFILNPITRGFYSFGLKTASFFEGQGSLEQLEEANQQLQDQINNLLIEKSKLMAQLESYEEIEDQLQFIEEKQFEAVNAQVIGLNSTADSKIFTLNKGSNNGIEEGYPVIIAQGILAGKILAVEPKTAKLQLIVDSGVTVSGEIQNESGSLGVVEGELGLSLKMTLIPQEDSVETDQLIITSGLDINVPRGLLIGQIVKMTTQTGELFQSATVNPVTPLDKINIVSIILP